MVEILVLSRQGGSYTDSVYGSAQSNPSVTIKVESWKVKFSDTELSIPIAETTPGNNPVILGGGFKRISIRIEVNGYLDAIPSGEGDVQTKIYKLWNIAEFGNPLQTYATYRGADLFGIASGGTGQIKINNLEIDEDARISEPAQSISGSTSKPFRAKVSFTITKFLRSS